MDRYGGNSGSVFNQSFSPMSTGNTLEQMENIQEVVAHISHTLLELNYGLIIGVFLVFFLLGYIFYSSIYAAIGSAVDNDTETQQFTLFVTIPLMLGLYGSISIMNNPDGPMGFGFL